MSFNEIKGSLIAKSGFAKVYSGFPQNFYEIDNAAIPESELAFAKLLIEVITRKESFSQIDSLSYLPKKFSQEFREKVVSIIELNSLLEKIPSNKLFIDIFENLLRLIMSIESISDKKLFAEYVLQNSIGLKSFFFFAADSELEELMVNDFEHVFVFHKKFGLCLTNISISEKEFDSTIQRINFSAGRKITKKNHLVDARLPDGSRVNITSNEVSPHGPSLTIRKFSTIPLTVLDLIENKTLTSELAAFFWVMVDGFEINPVNLLISGGTASGKTTLLNVLANFIRLDKRVISIEDTQEISLFERKNWVPLEARHIEEDSVNMDALLKNALRMRPDRIIVGEVRGKEALTLFTAMDTGHEGCLGTLHANNARETIIRLQEKPMEVPQSMLSLVDLIVVMGRTFGRGGKIFRHVSQVAEVSRMEKKVLLANVYEYDSDLDLIKRSAIPSHIVEVMAEKSAMTKNELKQEIEIRKRILEWMMYKGIRKPNDVLEVIQDYYHSPEEVLQMVGGN
jgi:archaeal flagellar protein FlaI